MISSTKPSSPTNACKRLAASTCVKSLAAHCSRNSSGSRTNCVVSPFKLALLDLHSENLQQPFQFTVAKVANFNGAFSLPITEMDFGSEPFAQAALNVGDVRVANGGTSVIRGGRSG